MSKKFEEEYKEYLNAQAPDLWDRIEAGIDASDGSTAVFVKDNVTPIRDRQHRKKNKNRQKYRRYKLITSIAACLFALVMIIPVYRLVAPKGGNESADMTAPIVLTDATIENTEVAADEAMPESAPQQSAGTGSTQPAEEPTGEAEESAAVTMESVDASEETGEEAPKDALDAGTSESEGNYQDQGQLASSQTEGNSKENFLATEESADGEAEAAEEKTMSVVVTAEGQMQESGLLYTASLLETSAPATITIFVPSESTAVLEKDKQYTVTVKADSAAGYYVLVSAQPVE